MALSENLLRQLDNGQQIRSKGYRGRFAPSPSGQLHIGNLRTALISWLRAKTAGGAWLLRIDDLDLSRNRSGAIESLKHDLLWLGLRWDGPAIFQSQRLDLYRSVLAYLKGEDRLYACRCSRSLLARLSMQEGEGFIYPGTCRDLGHPWEPYQGRLPSLRLRVNKSFSLSSGDVVLRRADGFIAYHFATVIDELTLGITEIVRGEDLAPSMQSQLAIAYEFGYAPLKYCHVPILCDAQGKKLAKRDGSEGLQGLISQGWTSGKVVGWLASSLGLVSKDAELSTFELLEELINREEDFKSLLKN